MRRFKLSDGKHGAALTIRVTPRSRHTEIAGVMADGTLRVRVPQPPVDGKANRALLGFLADVLDVRKSRIEIVAGHRGLDKIISILDMPASDVERRVMSWMKDHGVE
jgi:uncharacterized protein (TIGR00251 family)